MVWNSDPQYWGREQLACGGPKGEGMEGRQATGPRTQTAELPSGSSAQVELCAGTFLELRWAGAGRCGSHHPQKL